MACQQILNQFMIGSGAFNLVRLIKNGLLMLGMMLELMNQQLGTHLLTKVLVNGGKFHFGMSTGLLVYKFKVELKMEIDLL